MGGIEGESVTVTWKSQDPTPLPETGITKSKEAQVELVWLQTSVPVFSNHTTSLISPLFSPPFLLARE